MGYFNKGISIRYRYIIPILITCIVMLIWNAYCSPVFPYYNSSDSAIFMLIGKGITEGKLPYVDLFDHKGPVLFWIEALGWFIAGRTGIWILETVAEIISIVLIIKICDQLRSKCVLPAISTAVVYLSYFGRGNLCENYSLPFIFLCVYLAVCYYQSREIKHPWKYAFIYGICFALLAFIRVNNATVIGGFVLCIVIRLLVAKEYKNLISNVLAGLAGVLIITIPICVYFFTKGALQDMLFCTFTYNFIYAAKQIDLDGAGIIQRFITYMPIGYATVFFCTKTVRSDKKYDKSFYSSLFFVSLLCLVELLFTSMSAHYHTIALPLYSIAAAMTFGELDLNSVLHRLRINKEHLGIVCIALISSLYFFWSSYNACAPIYRHYITDACVSRNQDVQKCISVIPEDERDSVIGYEISTSWYIDSGITPCYKYYSMQHWWSSEGYDVNQQFLDYVSTAFPKWIITGDNIGDETLEMVLNHHYKLIVQGKWSYYRYVG